MNGFISFVGCLLLVVSCSGSWYTSQVQVKKNQLIDSSVASHSVLDKKIEPYKLVLEEKMNVKLAETPIELTKQGDNSHLGNLLADFILEAGSEWLLQSGESKGADAGILNIGGIRNNIGKGDILVKHIYEVMPFENEVVIVKMKGKDMDALFRFFEETQKNNPVSGLYIETDAGKSVKRLVGGKEVGDDEIYYLATSDYLAMGGDNMQFFQKGEILNTGIKLRDLFIEKMKKRGSLSFGEVEKRLNFKNKY